MAPKRRVDKGKAPMVEEDPPRRTTRARSSGVVIREDRRDERQPARGSGSRPASNEEEEEIILEPEVRQQPETTQEPVRAGTASGTGSELAAMRAMVASLTQTVQDFIQAQRRQADEPTHMGGPGGRSTHMPSPMVEVGQTSHVQPGMGLNMKAFHNMKPPVFRGQNDYRIVDDWISGMEKVFTYMQCLDEHKVMYAAYQLEGEAERWWKAEKVALPAAGVGLTWEEFRDKLFRHYVPASERAKRMTEFMALVQGRRSVAEYDEQFRSLARFVPWAQVDSAEAAQKFQEGLRWSIRQNVALFMLTRYEDILERARIAEREEEERQKFQERRRARTGDSGQKKKPRTESSSGVTSERTCHHCGQHGHIRPQCPVLKREGRKPTRQTPTQSREQSQTASQPRGAEQRKPIVCYQCGEPGHIRLHCPTLQRKSESVASRALPQPERGGPQMRGRGRGAYVPPGRQFAEQRPQTTAVVQATTVQEAQAMDHVVIDNLLVYNYMAYVLFDPGASQSFVSVSFVHRVGLSTYPMHHFVEVSTPLKAVSTASEKFYDIPLVIES